MAGTTYQQIHDAVTAYYGSGSDAWQRIYAGAGGYYSQEAANLLKSVPGVSVTYSNSGKVLGYSYANPFSAPVSGAAIIDSNVQTGSYGVSSFSSSIPSTYVDNGQGQLVAQSGSKLTATGATVATVVDRLSLAAIGVSLGTKLGKAVDSAIYNLNPDWWDENYPAINPETWDDIATTQGGRQVIQTIFGLENDSTTMYVDERLLAQTFQLLRDAGAFGNPAVKYRFDVDDVPPNVLNSTQYNQIKAYPSPLITGNTTVVEDSNFIKTYVGGIHVPYHRADGSITVAVIMGMGESVTVISVRKSNGQVTESYDDGTIPTGQSFRQVFISIPLSAPSYDVAGINYIEGNPSPSSYYTWVILNYGMPELIPTVDGITTDTRALTQIDPSVITGQNLPEILQQLKQNYPDLFTDSIYQDTPQEDGTVERITYIPVPIPDGITTPYPTTGETSQGDPSINPNTNTQTIINDITQIISQPETQPIPQSPTDPSSPTSGPPNTPNPPTTGDGNTPPVIPITGSASTLWKIYNPSQSEVDDFGAWLWSSNFIDQIKKLFNDPMQAIIGIHKVFCTPSIGGSTTIKCGYLDSGVSSNWVSNQYTHIDCGTVSLPEYFGNVFDYDPFTRVSIFLPCIGIVPLNVAEVMRSSVNVKLHCDVLTGALLAEVSITRDQAGGILYTYSGSCIVTYPVSSGTYIGAVANVVSIAASVAAGIMGTVATGGALAPAVVGGAGAAVAGLAHTRTNVQHSGSFSGAAGVMGGKIPYLIVTRPQTKMAGQYEYYDGVPANFTTRLSSCSGYVKVKEVHLKIPTAYESEITEIEELLHQGVLI